MANLNILNTNAHDIPDDTLSSNSDVHFTDIDSSDLLTYDASSQKWVNTSLQSLIGGLPTSPYGLSSGALWLNRGVVTVINMLPPITRAGTDLKVNGVTKRFSGANAKWLGLDDSGGTTSGTFANHSMIASSITSMREMGINLIRSQTIGTSTGSQNSYEPDAGTFIESNLDAADWAVYQAGLAGIYLMVPLTDNWNYYHGGKWNFVHWAYQQNATGLTDVNGLTKDDSNERVFFLNSDAGLRVRALYKDYISHWLNHVNPYNGLAYKDDPTIAIIETGNEIYYASQVGTDEWTQDIANYIKTIAPGKLIADGSGTDRIPVSDQPGLTASAVDIVGGHYFPHTPGGSYPLTTYGDSSAAYPAGSALSQLTADATAASNANKAYIAGSYAWTRTDISAWYAAIENNPKISADLFWRFTNASDTSARDFGSDDFPLHRPYLTGSEAAFAPALSRHISALTGIAPSNGAGTDLPVPPNLITASTVIHASDASIFSTGNGSVSTDTSVFYEGGSSLKVVPSGNNSYPYVYGSTPSQWAPVTPGSQYTGLASVRITTSGTHIFQAALVWFNSSGSFISSSVGTTYTGVLNTWTVVYQTATAPANAAYAVVQIQANTALDGTDIFNIDQYGIFDGTNIVWSV